MAAALGTVAGGFATAEMGAGERTRKGIVGNLETAQQFELALPQSRSKRSSGVVTSYCNNTIRLAIKRIISVNAKIEVYY